jgi:hypothetical protein
MSSIGLRQKLQLLAGAVGAHEQLAEGRGLEATST